MGKLRILRRDGLVLAKAVWNLFIRSRNFGDKLSPELVRTFTLRKPRQPLRYGRPHLVIIGSVLENIDEGAIVWGAGFMRANGIVKNKPLRVLAVRGPLSRKLLLRQGIYCPEVYGDPAILLDRMFPGLEEKSKKFGVVPHYADKSNPALAELRERPDTVVIDVESGIEHFVRAVKQCEVIFSSSLHGLVCADTFGIPNVRIHFGDTVEGGDFKFADYRLGVGSDPHEAVAVSYEKIDLTQLASLASLADTTEAANALIAVSPLEENFSAVVGISPARVPKFLSQSRKWGGIVGKWFLAGQSDLRPGDGAD